MTDPVLASDGYTYERASIVGWLATKSTSPATGGELDKNKLVPNHQLRSEIQTWAEYKESEDAGVCGDCREADGLEAVEAVIPAVTSRPVPTTPPPSPRTIHHRLHTEHGASELVYLVWCISATVSTPISAVYCAVSNVGKMGWCHVAREYVTKAVGHL